MDSRDFFADPLLVIARNAAAIAWSRIEHWGGVLDGHWTADGLNIVPDDHPLSADATGVITESEAAARNATSLVDHKGDANDLVTVADGEIEALIRGFLQKIRPQDTMVGEEGGGVLHLQDDAWGPVPPDHVTAPIDHPDPIEWHVDPIDGTVNFVRRMEHHCFSIGGRDARTGEWLVGLVASPALATTWFARKGKGAWKSPRLPQPHSYVDPLGTQIVDGVDHSEGEPRPFRPKRLGTRLHGAPAERSGQVVATGFGYSPERRAQQFPALLQVMEKFDDVRRCGAAAIDLCLAAEGRVDAYFERGLGTYDWAAGALIAEEAGLTVYRPEEKGDVAIAATDAELFTWIRKFA
ncbi:inositol monophosphatase family protein [Brevibacterium litoralis]|uniref:inositol monophosphatase family protein n=1 Tax=Brevibacterium litoralis TaxID=3138935 RepID=UPI0032EF7DDE